jgi:methylmalonyl-CoA/ethylmalonyl-CoA epimerase
VDVESQLRQASDAGVKLINEKPFDGAGGKLVAFLHPKSTFGVLTEFCMAKPA